MKFRWLGVAGIELELGDEYLVIDPCLTRAPLLNLLFGHIAPDFEQIRKQVPVCDYLLVTHAHFDHGMDAAEVLCSCGAHGYGSTNACRLMKTMGAPQDAVHVISDKDCLACGPFQVEVHKQDHPRTPIDRWINGELPRKLKPPLRLTDFRMDDDFGFLIQADGLRVLVGDLPIGADVLFTIPLKSRKYYQRLLTIVQPRLVIPIHWDLFLPETKLMQDGRRRSGITWRTARFLLRQFKRQIESLASTNIEKGYRVLIPQLFHPCELEEELHFSSPPDV